MCVFCMYVCVDVCGCVVGSIGGLWGWREGGYREGGKKRGGGSVDVSGYREGREKKRGRVSVGEVGDMFVLVHSCWLSLPWLGCFISE